MDITTLSGIGASVFTSVSLLPQMFRLLKDKKAENVSPWMLITLFAGLVLWVCYGALKNDLIILVANSFSLAVNIATLILTLKYKREDQ